MYFFKNMDILHIFELNTFAQGSCKVWKVFMYFYFFPSMALYTYNGIYKRIYKRLCSVKKKKWLLPWHFKITHFRDVTAIPWYFETMVFLLNVKIFSILSFMDTWSSSHRTEAPELSLSNPLFCVVTVKTDNHSYSKSPSSSVPIKQQMVKVHKTTISKIIKMQKLYPIKTLTRK